MPVTGIGSAAESDAVSAVVTALEAGQIVVRPGDDIAAKLLLAATDSKNLILTPGTYTFTSGITWDAAKHSVIGVGSVTLDFTALTSGYAIDVAPDGTDAFRGITHAMSNLKIVGPRSASTIVDGVRVQDSVSTNASHVSFEHIYIYGFRDQWFYGDNTWCVSQFRVFSRYASRYAINLDGMTNAGELYQFTNCTIADATNSITGTAVGVYTRYDGNVDATFTACSLDYNEIQVDHNGGALSFVGCHIENNNTSNPMMRLQGVAGSYRTSLTIIGGTVGPTEATARDHLFEVKSTSGDHAYLDFSGVTFATYNQDHVIFKNASSSLPTVTVRGGMFDNTGAGTKSASFGQYTNLLSNGDFDSSTSFRSGSNAYPLYPGEPWTHDGSVTYSFDTSVYRSSPRSLKMVGTGTLVTSGLRQMIAVTQGRRLYVTFWVNVTAVTAGSAQPRVSWYLDDCSTRTLVAYNPTAITAATSGWVPYVFSGIVPAGISKAQLDVQNSNLNGTVYVDDITAVML